VCLEVRQDLLESPAGVERWVRLLARVLRRVLEDPAARRPLPAANASSGGSSAGAPHRERDGHD
jgi:hypothetical protein